MSKFSVARRTGALTAGVLPPPGVPLPVHSVGLATWTGSAGALRANSALRRQLVRLSQVHRELRLGHLVEASRLARGLDATALGDVPPDTRRAISVLRAVDAARGGAERGDAPAENGDEAARIQQLASSLEVLRTAGPLPDTLLDVLLGPGSPLTVDAVRACWGASAADADSAQRISVLEVRRAGLALLETRDEPARQRVLDALGIARSGPLNPLLARWCDAVQQRLGEPDRLSDVLAALQSNLALASSRNQPLHRACAALYMPLPNAVQKPLARLTFGAWSTLREVALAERPPELVVFSGQFVAFRQVFEVLLDRALMRPFLASGPPIDDNHRVRALRRRETTLGLGTWRSLLFSRRTKGPRSLSHGLRLWFSESARCAQLRKNGLLEQGLNELLRVQLNALPHEETQARTTWREVFTVVCRVGYGVHKLEDLPQSNQGLVGALVVAAREGR